MEKLLTPEQAAEYLQVSNVTVIRWLKEGKITGHKVGRFWRIKEVDIQEYLDKQKNS